MRKILFCILAVVVVLPLLAVSGDQAPSSKSYYETLRSLVKPKGWRLWNTRPEAPGRDVNLIDPEMGAGGVVFGESMDDVVAVWGKPTGIFIDGLTPVWQLDIDACDFEFIENKLVGISIHRATLGKAYLNNGIDFGLSYEEVQQIAEASYGAPLKAEYNNLEFETENGYSIRFHFIPNTSIPARRDLIVVRIRQPGPR